MSKPEQVNERKNHIISATIECIARYGYYNFSMQDVARLANVSKGIIHYYFMNKEELMMAVLDKVAGDIESLLTDVINTTSDPKERLRNLLRICFRIVKDKREYYCINIDFWTQINQKEPVRQAIAAHYAKFRNVCKTIIQEGMDSGIFKSGNPAHLATLIIGIVDGISIQWLFDSGEFDYNTLISECEEHVLNFLVNK